MDINEYDRIVNFNSGEQPNKGYLLFIVETDESFQKLMQLKEVIIAISKFNEQNWPDDETWDNSLPKWFLTKIKSHSIEEISQESRLLWEYGSWLDAMKFRGWEWYSSKLNSNGFEIILDPCVFPFSVNPFEYIIFELDVELKNIKFRECSSG